ncbi:MAG: outer membrane lipoprotein-sorting protein [Firmicutes bacterium]|jgi:outer membrane lipoprotein-sorting protein|nr:outer membrane lipoprotein-sorting protein [Bacillota bacterium]
MEVSKGRFSMRAIIGTLAVLALVFAVTREAVPAPTPQEILDSIQGQASLTGSSRAVIEMTVEKGRQSKIQRLAVYRSDDGRGTTKQFVEFQSPADVRGTKFLSITAPGQEDQMWIYLPAVGRERRIAGSAVQGKFMGTDFTYEEIAATSGTWSGYNPELRLDEHVDGRDCYSLVLTPKTETATYSSVKMAVWKEGSLPIRIEFESRGAKPTRVMSFHELEKNARGKWQPKRIVLHDTGAGSVTTLRILETSDDPVPDEVFTLRYLRK